MAGYRGRKREEWEARLSRFEHAGTTVAKFCAAEGVSAPSFYHWRRKLLAAEAAPSPHGSAFRALQVTSSRPAMMVRLASGVTIEVSAEAIAQVLAELLRADTTC